jgi:7-cyano-7-deazaguanine synthase
VSRQAVVIFSGGLDSTTLLYHLRSEGWAVRALSADYGQRHGTKELAAARGICHHLEIDHRVVDLTALAGFFGQSSLVDPSTALPEGRYESATMKLTTVPNRNMILLSIGIAWAVSVGCQAVAFGAHAGEYTPYPDCQPAFAEAMDRAAGLCDWQSVSVLAPFVTWSKADIVRRGVELGVPFEHTWSCYAGGERHCGRCGTCLDRRDGFAKAGLVDPAVYQTPAEQS